MNRQLWVDKNKTLHGGNSLTTGCGQSTNGMSTFESYTSFCEKCFGQDMDFEKLARMYGTRIPKREEFALINHNKQDNIK